MDEAQENIESALDEVDTEELQQQAEEAQEQIESAVDDIDTEALQQQAEEAQKEFEEQLRRRRTSAAASALSSTPISRSSPPAWRISTRAGDAVEVGLGGLRPLDEGDRVRVQVVVQQRRVLALEVVEPVEVEVRDRHPARGSGGRS